VSSKRGIGGRLNAETLSTQRRRLKVKELKEEDNERTNTSAGFSTRFAARSGPTPAKRREIPRLRDAASRFAG
jgi:hypothetical protein